MSILVHHLMTNHHAQGVFSELADTIGLWRERYRARRELAQWTERDLHDVGLSWSDVAYEADKPFWRA